MTIMCVGFGSLWFQRSHGPGRVAWYNTTGITRTLRSRHVLRLWTFSGLVRFNGSSFPWVSSPDDLPGVLCLTSGIERTEGGGTRLLCERPLRRTAPVDAYLVSVRSTVVGSIDRSGVWRSKSVKLIAASSHSDGRQEFLLLVRQGAWIKTDLGYWRLGVRLDPNAKPALVASPSGLETLEQ